MHWIKNQDQFLQSAAHLKNKTEIIMATKGLYHNVNKRKKAGISRRKNHPNAPSDQDWKKAAKTAKVSEGLAEFASEADTDHEVQMAKSELYQIAEHAIKMYKMLNSVSESQGLEAWMQSKITKAADYIDTVYHSLEHDMLTQNVQKSIATGMTESERVQYVALLEKAKTKAQQRYVSMMRDAKKGKNPTSDKVEKVSKNP